MTGRRQNVVLAADPHDWDIDAVAMVLGCDGAQVLGATLGSIDKHGYHQFVLAEAKKRRVISRPRPQLKKLQYQAYKSILEPLPISQAAYCRPGGGVVKNAQQHTGHSYLTILDVANCFPSTCVAMVRDALRDHGIPSGVVGALSRLTTYHGVLPQGPPTSPAVLNLVFRSIDNELTALAERYGAVYTRYMDDLAFSGDRPLTGLSREAVHLLRRFGYRSNPGKRREWGPSDRHTITKIVISTTLNPTPEFLAELAKHLRQLGSGNCGLTEDQLRGKIAWVTALSPALGHDLEAWRQRAGGARNRPSGRAA